MASSSSADSPAPVNLAFRHYPAPGRPALVILHGLLGSSRNWIHVAKDLADAFDIYTVDLRNHGSSPHNDLMDFPSMSADLAAFLQQHQLGPVHLLGHSLGGKVIMRFACDHPHSVLSLSVADIAPRGYGMHFREAFDAMLALDLNAITTRKEADEALALNIPDWAFRQFLLTNLERPTGQNALRWCINLPVLAHALPTLRANSLHHNDSSSLPTLFLVGERSDFVLPSDHELIHHHFPKADIQTIPNAGHNVHTDNRPAFVDALRQHLLDNNP